jgi:hypothetical protein
MAEASINVASTTKAKKTATRADERKARGKAHRCL